MLAENPIALRFILPDDVYLLPADRLRLYEAAEAVAEVEKVADAVAVAGDVEENTNAVVAEAEVKPEPEKTATPTADDLKIPRFSSPEPKAPVAEPAARATPPVQPQFVALGNNQKNILVLVNYPGDDFMEAAHLQALEGAFGRLGSSRADFAIVNIAQYPDAKFEDLSTHFKPQTLLLLGADSYPQGLPQQPFNQLRQGKGRKLLFTYSFKEMMGDKEKTRTFWEQMKNL